MLNDVKYLKYEGNEKLVDEFYSILFSWRRNTIVDVLKKYVQMEGNAVNEEMRCYFANEFPEKDEEYFGNSGIAFYFDDPSVLEDCIIILSNIQFIKIVKEKYMDYIKIDEGFRDEICKLIVELEEKLKDM